MPDQSSAATEHAILQEITAPLETLPDDPVAMVHADFPSALRGYDRVAVDAYVQQVSRLVAELQATRSPEAAVRRALERVGEQISGILQRAHETAEQITAQSRAEAEDRMEAARGEAAEIIAAAQQRVKDLDADTDRIWIERHRIVDDARELSAQLLSVVENAGERFPPPEGEPEPESELDEEAAGAELPYAEDQDEAYAGDKTEAYAGEETEAYAGDETEVYDEDVEATRQFEPLTEERRPPTRSVIPPASQAGTDRQASE